MRPLLRRVTSTLVGVLISVLTTGCDVVGTVDVRSEHEILADFRYPRSQSGGSGCTQLEAEALPGFSFEEQDGTCHVTGDLSPRPEGLEEWLRVATVGEYLLVDLTVPQLPDGYDVDLTLTFPGAVVESGGGVASGNSVRFPSAGTDAPLVAHIVAFGHPGPERWVLAGAGGLIGGLVVTLVLAAVVRRRARTVASVPGPDADAGPFVPDDRAADHLGIGVPDPLAPPNLTFAPGIPGANVSSGSEPGDRPGDGSTWADGGSITDPAGARAPIDEGSSRDEPPPQPVDHSVWAPPEGH